MLGMLLVILIIIAVFMAVTGSVFRRWNRFNRPYEFINKRYQGQLYRSFVFTNPKLWFDYGNVPVRLQNKKSFRTGRRRTELNLRWNERRSLNFEITRKPTSSSGASRRVAEVEIPIPELKEKFLVLSNQPEVMQRLLTSAVCWQINQLDALSENGTLNVRLRRGVIKIEVGGWFIHDEKIDDFVRFSLELYDRFQLAECEGINFVNEDEVGVVEVATCPICSEAITYAMVVCVRCKTPHCLDCWHYNGQCATFACDEKRYLKT